MFNVKYVAILLTAHNRKEKTLDCLEHLYAQQKVDGYEWEVYLTDDGCTDGTAEAVSTQFPLVNLVQGDGSLYWNGGMHLAWKAATQHKVYDFYMWLNDDTILSDDAIKLLLHTSDQFHHQSIVVGTTCSINDVSVITYGGRTSNGSLISPSDEPQTCNFFNGNIVLFPKYVYEIVGMNDIVFRHALGDFDYGLRANKLGIKSFVAAGVLGKCDQHESLAVWCNPEKSFKKRWSAFRTPLGQSPEEFYVFEKRHRGFRKAIWHYITNHIRVVWPGLWIK